MGRDRDLSLSKRALYNLRICEPETPKILPRTLSLAYEVCFGVATSLPNLSLIRSSIYCSVNVFMLILIKIFEDAPKFLGKSRTKIFGEVTKNLCGHFKHRRGHSYIAETASKHRRGRSYIVETGSKYRGGGSYIVEAGSKNW